MAIPYVLMKGRLGTSGSDTVGDVDEDPDLIPCISGQVKFTPLTKFSKLLATSGVSTAPMLMGNAVVVATINSTGQLTVNGSTLFRLLDFTSPLMSPSYVDPAEASWEVSFIDVRSADGQKVDFPTFKIAPLAGGVENDLASLAPTYSYTVSATLVGSNDKGLPFGTAALDGSRKLLEIHVPARLSDEALTEKIEEVAGSGGGGSVTWDTITDKPAVVASGVDEADARDSIGAGTSNLALGNTSTNALAGDITFAGLSLSSSPDAASVTNNLRVANTTAVGVVELATNAETVTGTDGTRATTPAGVAAAIAALVNSSPSTLDTLNELATALGNDPSFATTMTTALAGKVPTTRTVAGQALSADITAAVLTNNLRAATTSVTGVAELATGAETAVGTDPDRLVTPAGLASALATLVAQFVPFVPILVLYNKTTDTWPTPASTSPSAVRWYISTNDSTATSPTFLGEYDIWLPAES